MKLTESSILQLKAIKVLNFRIEENIKGKKKFNLDGDFEVVGYKLENDVYKGIEFKLDINKGSKNAALKAHIEILALFNVVDKEMSEKDKTRFMLYNGLSIVYGIIRGMIYQACSALPPDYRVLPAVNIKDFIKSCIEEKLKEKL
ncbi:hypothetical protein [Hippea sp. KM1]|uniref:hypothetical protein n=1 Tax=Hippea sp. KM1 TaxID=944481 RepID=UPI00046D95A0|nr:hypothetical protein [Hippea sp. KM1]